jgi:hypothetical protein
LPAGAMVVVVHCGFHAPKRFAPTGLALGLSVYRRGLKGLGPGPRLANSAEAPRIRPFKKRLFQGVFVVLAGLNRCQNMDVLANALDPDWSVFRQPLL